MADHVIAEKAAIIAGTNEKGSRTRTRIREGKVYRADDPIVRGREHLFRPVEETTAVPGEKRNVRRTRKRTETPAEEPPKATASKSAATAESDSDDDE